jgi:hypothetical protein
VPTAIGLASEATLQGPFTALPAIAALTASNHWRKEALGSRARFLLEDDDEDEYD